MRVNYEFQLNHWGFRLLFSEFNDGLKRLNTALQFIVEI